MKSKRGLVFSLGLVLIALVVLGYSAYVFWLKNKYFESRMDISERSLQLFQAYQEAEKIKTYIDAASYIAVEQSIYDLSNNGGFAKEAPCGEYLGYSLWKFNCKPIFEEEFNVAMNENMEILLSAYPQFSIKPSFLITTQYDSTNNLMIVKGTTTNRIQIPLLPLLVGSLPTTKPEVNTNVLLFIKQKYEKEINQALSLNNIPKELAYAVIAQESGGDQYAISETGCAGIAQFCYSTAKDYAKIFYFDEKKLFVCCPYRKKCTKETAVCPIFDDRFNVQKSLNAMAHYYKKLLNHYEGYKNKVEFAAMAYNAGQGAVDEALKTLKKLGVSDPTLQDVLLYLDVEQKKRIEVYSYVTHIQAYMEEYKKLI